MVYGRLDVFGPEGTINTFPLSSSNVSVGRSSGNTIMLDNSTISRYHFNIVRENGQVYLSDLESANGTYIDGVKLPGNDRRLLGGGEEILIGNLRIIYHHMDDTPTQPMGMMVEATQRLESANAEFVVDLHEPGQSVSPGAHISAELSITNLTDRERRYVVEVIGLPKEWVRVDRPKPLVDARDQTMIVINLKPARRSDSKPGQYPIGIRVYPQDKTDDVIETSLMLDLLPYNSFSALLHNSRLVAGENFALKVHNLGSAPLPLLIQGRDLASGSLNFHISPARVQLQPGQKQVIQGVVNLRRGRLFGEGRAHPFDLLVRSEDAAAFVVPMRGYVLEKALAPRWVLFLLAAFASLVALALLVVIALVVLRPAPMPTLTNAGVSRTLVARGETFDVYWQATDVVDFRLSIDGTPVRSESDPRATAFAQVDTSAFSGPVVVRLDGYNGEQQTSVEWPIQIYQPVTGIQTFSITPPQLVRYVVTSLSIQWDVPGAVYTRLSGLESFTSVILEANGPTGDFEGVAGIARDPLTVRLIAQDEVGNAYEQTLTLNVTNPECTPAGDTVTLHAGPDTAHQVIGSVPVGDPVVVNAQDVSGLWLRVLLPGQQTGWGLAGDFVCADNFALADLFKEADVPPPPPTPTFVPTLPPTPPPPTPAPTFTPRG